MRPIAALTLWLFVIGTSLILGAGLYEALVVVPFWSAGAPGSLAEGNPLLQVQVRAGHAFWQYFTPALGLIALLALLTSFGAPPRHLAWRLAATCLMLLVSIVTLVYFRPAVIGMVVMQWQAFLILLLDNGIAGKRTMRDPLAQFLKKSALKAPLVLKKSLLANVFQRLPQ